VKWVHRVGLVVSLLAGVAALILSVYNFWTAEMQPMRLQVYVPAQGRYAAPFEEKKYEVFELSATFSNSGGRSGAIVEALLEIKDGARARSFAATSVGSWSLDRATKGELSAFYPLALAKNESTSAVLIFEPVDSDKANIVAKGSVYAATLKVRTRQAAGWFQGQQVFDPWVEVKMLFDISAFSPVILHTGKSTIPFTLSFR
jgi:hypothetical protein